MKKTVYIETSAISYLTARIPRDIVPAARQRLTQVWWDFCRGEFELFVSPEICTPEKLGGVNYG